MNTNYNNSNINYTGRCKEIRDAKKICHVVGCKFPHISTTKIDPMITKLRVLNRNLYKNFLQQQPVDKFSCETANDRSAYKIFSWHAKFIKRLSGVRDKWLSSQNDYQKCINIIDQFKEDKFGNCAEDAFMASVMLKLNGVKSAYTARLTSNFEPIDHAVCIFNKDGSKFTGEITKHTIIVDPWLGDADFVPNMFLKYKNTCQKYMPSLNHNSIIEFRNVRETQLSNIELANLKSKLLQ